MWYFSTLKTWHNLKIHVRQHAGLKKTILGSLCAENSHQTAVHWGASSRWHRLGRPEQTLATSTISLDQCDAAVGLRCAPKPPTVNSGAVRLQRSALSFAHCQSKPVLVACSAVHCGHYYCHYCIILIIIVDLLWSLPRATPFLCFFCFFLFCC